MTLVPSTRADRRRSTSSSWPRKPGLADQLHYDAYERRSGLVRFLAADADATAWAAADAVELSDAVDGPYAVTTLEAWPAGRHPRCHGLRARAGPATVRVVKTIAIGGGRLPPTLSLTVTVENRADTPVEARLGIEWTLTMLGGGGNPAAWWEVAGERSAHDGRGSAAGVGTVGPGQRLHRRGGEPRSVSRTGRRLVGAGRDGPCRTRRGGFERAYQGAGLLLSWPLDLAPGRPGRSS